MRFIRRRLIVILVIAFIVIFGEIALASAIKRNQPLTQPPIKITQAFKDIAYNPDSSQEKNIPNNPNEPIEQREINDFAWKVFVALNWPVDCQGKPLSYTDPLSGNKYPKIIGQAPKNPRVWELYPSPKDVFLPNGAKPLSLDKLPEDERCLNDRAGSEIEYKQNLRLTETDELVGTNEFGEVNTANKEDLLDGYGELKEGISLRDIDAANQIPLVDRQGNYVINEIRINPVEFKQIVEKKWYDGTELLQLINSDREFKLVCSNGTQKNKKYCDEYEAEGAIEIKAVWRVFDGRNTEQEKARYYTTKRKIVSKKGESLNEQAELGLIGFHIMHKTSSRGWIWSTFEHIDNAPPCTTQTTRLYTLYNNKCKTGNCKENVPYVKQPYLWDISNDEPKAVTIEVIEGTAVKDQVPSQICRASSISQSATDRNNVWQNSLRAISESSVWQYYQLIGTQWLQHPEFPYSNTERYRREITPDSPPLTNVALEPYAQRVSCIVCHTSARLPSAPLPSVPLPSPCLPSAPLPSAPLPIQGNFCQLNGDGKNCADFSFLMDNAQFSKQIPVQANQ